MKRNTSYYRLGVVAGLWLGLAAAHAQPSIEWQASFGGSGGDNLYSVQPTSDGGYILGGVSHSGVSGNKTTPNFGSGDYWLVKVDGSGNKQWEQDFGGSGDDQLWSVQPTSDGGYILGGDSDSDVSGNKTTPGFGSGDCWLVKVDGSGNKQWEQVFGGSDVDLLVSVQPTSDGGYILGGVSSSGVSGNKTTPNFGGSDYWLVKVDASGNKQWEQVFGGSGNDWLYSVQPTSDGGYILGGSSFSGVSGNKTTPNFGSTAYDYGDYWLVKVDGSGNKQWESDFGGSSDDGLFSMQATSDGGYILGGVSSSGVSGNKTTPNFGSSDCWLVKVDGGGNKQWEKVFGGTSADGILSVQPTSDGGYILGGSSWSGVSGNKTTPNFGFYDFWLVKVDRSGNKQWEQVFGGSGPEQLWSVQPTSDGGYILGGDSDSGVSGNKTTPNFGGSDYWLVKLSPPPAQFRLTAGSLTNGTFTLHLSGLSGHGNVVIYASTNLTAWTPIFTNPPVTGSLDYVDSPPSNRPQRFYRAAETP
jgi:hypothetical protein